MDLAEEEDGDDERVDDERLDEREAEDHRGEELVGGARVAGEMEDAEARMARTGEDLLYLDLAHEWFGFTGLPWISAFWALTSTALADTGMPAAELIAEERSRY